MPRFPCSFSSRLKGIPCQYLNRAIMLPTVGSHFSFASTPSGNSACEDDAAKTTTQLLEIIDRSPTGLGPPTAPPHLDGPCRRVCPFSHFGQGSPGWRDW